MKISRYKTDKRLWMWITLGLFVPFWFTPCFGIKQEAYAPIMMLRNILINILHGQISYTEACFIVLMLLAFMAVIGCGAAIIAWPIQCVIVIFKTKAPDKITLMGPEQFHTKQVLFVLFLPSSVTALSWFWLGESAPAHGNLFGIFWFIMNIPAMAISAAFGGSEHQFFLCVFFQWLLVAAAISAYVVIGRKTDQGAPDDSAGGFRV